jgi:hypothetical protein
MNGHRRRDRFEKKPRPMLPFHWFKCDAFCLARNSDQRFREKTLGFTIAYRQEQWQVKEY